MLKMMKSINSLTKSVLVTTLIASSVGVFIGCDSPKSSEDLNPAGPPMIRQVLITENVTTGGITRALEGQLAFGKHEDKFFEDDDGIVNTAITLPSQEIRIIFDEILRGNRLEEVECADGSYSVIPDGTTPDDISDCAGTAVNCKKVCIDTTTNNIIGVKDDDDNKSADSFRMRDYNPDPKIIELGVMLKCDGVDVPLSQEFSFWSPSGNQTFPSNPILSYRGLGPALIIKPEAATGLRSGAKCNITFRDDVTDYDNNVICAPANGIPKEGCDEGDTSKVSFSTEVLTLESSIPSDEAVDVSSSDKGSIVLVFNANIDTEIAANFISLTANGTDVAITPKFQANDPRSILISFTEPFEAGAKYELKITSDFADVLGGTLAADKIVTWTVKSEPL